MPHYTRDGLFGVTLAELALLLFFLLAFLAFLDRQKSQRETEQLRNDVEKHAAFKDSVTAILNLEVPEDVFELVEATRAIKDSLTDRVDQLSEERLELRGQVVNLQRRANGLDHPPCWPVLTETDFGRPEYIYAVYIHENHLRVESVWPPHREDDVDLIPHAREMIGDSLSMAEFRKHAEPVLQWSVDQIPECRHFVEVHDRAVLKNPFLDKLLTVEHFFYKLLIKKPM